MKLVNKSSMSDDDIRAAVQGYPIIIEIVGDLPIIEDSQGVFVNDARGLLVTDDTYKSYGGLTYEYGATSVYDIANTIERLGDTLGKRVCFLRVIHECGHHYKLDMDGLDNWFVHHPIWKFIYYTFGQPLGESTLSCAIQEMYYKELYSKIESEEKFDEDNDMENRTYNGLKR